MDVYAFMGNSKAKETDRMRVRDKKARNIKKYSIRYDIYIVVRFRIYIKEICIRLFSFMILYRLHIRDYTHFSVTLFTFQFDTYYTETSNANS